MTFTFFIPFIFIFGLIVGSFLNCVIYRLEMWEKGEITCFVNNKPRKTPLGFLRGKSFCPNCKHILFWQDLIPIFSYLFLKGKCRYCKEKISIQYPLVEIATALLFLFIFWALDFEFGLIFGFWILISCFLIIVFVFDFKHYIIPDKIVYSAIIIAFLCQLFNFLDFENCNLFGIWSADWRIEFVVLKPLFNYFISGVIAASFFLAIVLVSRGKWMGGGDVKLAFFMGLFLGWPKILVALFFSFFIGAIISIVLMLFKKKGLKSEIPFGPFLIIGTYIALFWGNEIARWYLNILTY